MNKILSENEIRQFREEGAVFLKNKFNINWINKLKKGIERDINNPSPRFKSHTIEKNVPAYLEDYWTWHLIPEFKEFVYKSPYAQIASELMSAKKINLVMDNSFGEKCLNHQLHFITILVILIWTVRCVFYGYHCNQQKNREFLGLKDLIYGINILGLFKDGHKVEGDECIVNGKKYNYLQISNKNKYEFLQWVVI